MVVECVQHEILETPVTIYNFEVEDFHTYYVGEQSVLVHNRDCRRTTSQNAQILAENMKREGRVVGDGEAAAHIVASNGSKKHWASAADSRALLSKYGIDTNDAANGVPMQHPRPHNLTHTKSFNDMVNTRLHGIEDSMVRNGYGKKAIRREIRRTLRQIGMEIGTWS